MLLRISGLRCLAPLCFSLMALFQQTLHAETIEIELPNGTIGTANFSLVATGRASVLMLHGFMQTRNFPTVTRLADGLLSAGYSVLAPTLSLGISRRLRSLSCEAIHRHTMEQDVAEISAWVDWLARRKPGPIVIVAHSYGSLQSLVYASGKPSSNLRQVIALSLVDAERQSDMTRLTAMLVDAKKRIARKDTQLVQYPFGYCKHFVSTPQSFLSYAHWTRADILKMSRKIKVPLEVIIGSQDDRMGEDWPGKLTAAGNHVNVIEGANHFFDAEHEFDVLDMTLGLLKSGRTQN